MPIEVKNFMVREEEVEAYSPLQRGSHMALQFGSTIVHIFCNPSDSEGTVFFRGETDHLALQDEAGDFRGIAKDEMLKINSRPVIIASDDRVLEIRYSSVLATFHHHRKAYD